MQRGLAARRVLAGLSLLTACPADVEGEDVDASDTALRASPMQAEDVFDQIESTTLVEYPVIAARSVKKDARCNGDLSHLDEVEDYLAAVDAGDFGDAVAALAAFQRRLYCLGFTGMRALDLAIGSAIQRAIELPEPERGRAVRALFNPAVLLIDQLAFTRESFTAQLMRLHRNEIELAMKDFPTDDIGMMVLRPATGSLVRLPSQTCSATWCGESEQQMLAMLGDPKRFGLGNCNWLSLAHNEWVCTAGLPCGAEPTVDFDEMQPADPDEPRWRTHGTAHGDEIDLRYRSLHGDAVVAYSDATREAQKTKPTETERALWPARTLEGLTMIARTPNAESEGDPVHVIFGEEYSDADFMGMCGGALQPVNMPWATPPYDLFECLLDQRAEYEASVDCIGQGNAILLEELRLFSFDVGGNTGVLDPACNTNPLAATPNEGGGYSFTCEELWGAEACVIDDGEGPVNSEPGHTPTEAAEHRQTAAFARAEARSDASVASDLTLAKIAWGSNRSVSDALAHADSAPINVGNYNFGQNGGCEDAAACYDANTHTIYVQANVFADPQLAVGVIVHELMHAALTYLGVAGSEHHGYIGNRGYPVTTLEEGEPIIGGGGGGHRMPGPEGNDCSVFSRMMDATLECLDDLAHPGGIDPTIEGYRPWSDPRKAFPNPEAEVEEVDECLAYAVGGGNDPGSSVSPCNFMHCIEPDNCWCAGDGLPDVQLRGLPGEACGRFTNCGPDMEIDPVTCQCLPIGGLDDPDFPDNPLGNAWAQIDVRMKAGTEPADVLFPKQMQAPQGLFPEGPHP